MHWFDPSYKPPAEKPDDTSEAAVNPIGLPEDYNTSALEEPSSSLSAAELYGMVQESADKLFFIAYRHNGALRPTWYLAAVDMKQTTRVTSDPAASYWEVLLALLHASDRRHQLLQPPRLPLVAYLA